MMLALKCVSALNYCENLAEGLCGTDRITIGLM